MDFSSYIYKPRIADSLLKRKLQGTGAVLIEGPKWCGKTTTAEQQAKSIIYLDEPASRINNINTASIDPHLILEGDNPRLIDEWQIAPSIWDAVRFEVDHRHREGLFILTGSAVPNLSEQEKERMHTGTGRISRLKMRTMSLWESGESNGTVSLKNLFEGKDQQGTSLYSALTEIAFLACRGGWPKATFQERDIALDRAFDYYDAIVNYDIKRISSVLHNSGRLKKIMRSYARFQGTQTSINTIVEDIKSSDSEIIDPRTVQAYIEALRLIFVVEDMEAWNPNLRSKTAIRSASTRYFSDPSIATAALGVGPDDLLHDLNTFGFIFETLCARDLRVYAEALQGEVFHYRDSKGLECDAVIHLRNGKYGLIEIKLGGDKLIEEGVTNLLRLKSKINTEKMQEPSFMMVLTATGQFAYKREDGVHVVPISTLKD